MTTIIDGCYPKALQHTFYTEDNIKVSYNITALDIAKDYPSVLLTNGHDIMLCNIRNTVHKFDGELKTREYYINKTHIDKYKTANNEPITIEAGFYGRNLIDYQLKHKYITLSDIKHQPVADKSITHDAFKRYMKYIFDNFELTAKKVGKSI